MTTSPQDDLTAERAAAVEEQISDAINRLAYPSATIRRIVKDAIKQTRQEALREAAKVARNRADLLKPKLGLWLNMVNYHRSTEADELADELDRLAREGVTG